jgi:hypothetical protein
MTKTETKSIRRTWNVGRGPSFDDRDAAILAARVAAFDPVEGPRVGDYVEFIDGVTRQISYVWPDGVQTSDGGSFYLGDGYMSFSGGLYPTVPTETLTLTDDVRETWAWFFHHDDWTGDNDVHVPVLMRVWKSTAKAPK